MHCATWLNLGTVVLFGVVANDEEHVLEPEALSRLGDGRGLGDLGRMMGVADEGVADTPSP